MKQQYFINANIIDPYNSLNENGGLIISTDFADEICEMWYLHFVFSSRVRSLSIIILSAMSGIPDNPNLVAIIPVLIMPFFDKW